MRDDGGALRNIKVVGETEREALVNLSLRAEQIRTGGSGPELTSATTVAEACAIWLADKRASGRVTATTLEAYENTIKTVVTPACGNVSIGELTVTRCDRILRRLLAERSASAARKARNILSQVCGSATRVGVMPNNPIRDTLQLPTSTKKNSYLTPAQLRTIRDLIDQWRLHDKRGGPRPDAAKLRDGIDIMVGTSARIGEALALRRCDVDIAGSPPTLLIAATLTETREEGLVRKPSPKRMRQTRRVALPSFAAEAVRRRLSLIDKAQGAYLFETKSGRPISISNFKRLLRDFVTDNKDALRGAGIPVEEFSSHIFRRTAATLIENTGGITLASRLLGHSSETITRANYVVTAELVDPMTAVILDAAMTTPVA